MGSMMNLKRLLVGLTVMVAMLVAASLTLAQEATATVAETASAAPQMPNEHAGSTIFLLVGLGVIAITTIIWLYRERTETNPESA